MLFFICLLMTMDISGIVYFCRLDADYANLMKKHSYLEAEKANLDKQLVEVKTQRNNLQQTEQLLKQVN